MAGPDDREVPTVRRGDPGQPEAPGDGRHGGIDVARRKIKIRFRESGHAAGAGAQESGSLEPVTAGRPEEGHLSPRSRPRLEEVKEDSNNGRTISEDDQHGTYLHFETYLLRFKGDPSKCVGSSNDIQTVEIKPCNGGTGVIWAKDVEGNNVYRWINRYASENNDQGQTLYLTGRGMQGSGFIMVPISSFGLFQKFSFE